jgi:sodium-dependent dicarboxylate transporter 2/3/5
MTTPHSPTETGNVRQRVGLIAGPVVFAAALLTPPPTGLSAGGWQTAAVALLMAIWWITEAVPIPVTALLPLIVLPVLGVGTIRETAAPYANPIIFLFLGGFMLAAALERSGLHRRFALAILRIAGGTPSRLVAGFMIATAFLSMWVSNTATTMMMLPIALSIIALPDDDAHSDAALATTLLLGIAYAANIGGMGTLIGTPPNALLAGFLEETYGVTLGFAEWMLIGVPLVLVSLPLCWLWLCRGLPNVGSGGVGGSSELLATEWRKLGSLSRREVTVGVIAGATALTWMARPLLVQSLPGISDAGIAIAGATLLFLVPVDWRRLEFSLTWRDVERLPWGILILFGGGLTLAASIQRSGLADWIGLNLAAVEAWPLVGVVATVTIVIIFLTEINSNTATAATFLPIVASLALGIGLDPMALALPAALAASCAFMLPVATPPNAIVYASDRLPLTAMLRAGFVLNLGMVVAITVLVMVVGWITGSW